MFTGIIRYLGEVMKLQTVPGGKRLQIKADSGILSRLEKSITSVAINGSCHTVEEFDTKQFSVFSSFETLKKTNLNELSSGDFVNLELPLTIGSFLDGHLVQGHVDGVGRISSIQRKGEAYLYRFTAENSLVRYLVEKDSIAIDGVSLTLFNISDGSFQVAVIPETVENTALSKKKEGNSVNIEINVFAKYSFKFSKERNAKFEEIFQ
jgi:riboflavin synthase